MPSSDLAELIQELTDQMKGAAAELQFEVAARLRDEIRDLKKELRQMMEATRSERTSREVQVTFDCADPRALSLFWNDVLGYVFPPPPPGFDSWDALLRDAAGRTSATCASASVDPAGDGPRLFFQQVPEGKTVEEPGPPRRPGRARARGRRADGGAGGGVRAPGRPRRDPGRAPRARARR